LIRILLKPVFILGVGTLYLIWKLGPSFDKDNFSFALLVVIPKLQFNLGAAKCGAGSFLL